MSERPYFTWFAYSFDYIVGWRRRPELICFLFIYGQIPYVIRRLFYCLLSVVRFKTVSTLLNQPKNTTQIDYFTNMSMNFHIFLTTKKKCQKSHKREIGVLKTFACMRPIKLTVLNFFITFCEANFTQISHRIDCESASTQIVMFLTTSISLTLKRHQKQK